MANNLYSLENLTRPTRVRYYVLAALCFAAVLAYFHRGCLAVPKETISEELLKKDYPEEFEAKMDQVQSAFFLGYALFQIPGGWLGDRFGTRLILTLFLLIWSSATGLMALADGFFALAALQLVNGMAQACIFPCCVKTFARWFPASEKAFPNGLLGSFMSVGGAVQQALTGFLLGYFLWQGVLVLYAIPGILFALWFAYWFRNRPEQHAWVNEEERRWIEGPHPQPETPATDLPAPVPWRTVLTSGRLGLICGQQFFRAAAYIFLFSIFPEFLQKGHGISQDESGYWSALPLLGVVFGSLTGGLVMDWIWRRTGNRTLSRKGIALVGMLGAAVFMALAFLADSIGLMMAAITAAAFCGGLTGPAGYTITIDQGGRHVATVFSIMNTAGNVGATFLPVVLGAFVRWTSWDDALLFVACLYVGAALCWALLQAQGSIFAEASRGP